mgnify:CR=1 FL=1
MKMGGLVQIIGMILFDALPTEHSQVVGAIEVLDPLVVLVT